MERLLAELRRGLPQQVRIPPNVDDAFSALWQLSTEPPCLEWGTSIIQTTGGILTTGSVVKGSCSGISFPSASLEQPGFVGVFHTHPLPLGGTGVAFSPENMASVIEGRISICVVQSGADRFLLGNRALAGHGLVARAVLQNEFRQHLDQMLTDSPPLAFQHAVLRANRLLCVQLGLCLYMGRGRFLEWVV